MYDFRKIEDRWQKKWNFETKKSSKKKFYMLEMWPYPSGYGLHMGHARNYTMGDVLARFKRMNGFNVLYPMGYDSFGLPAENAAIKEGIHPLDYTEKAIKNYIRQQKSLGLSYDWSRMIASHMPEYYRWDQWIFLQFLKKGLAYRKKALVNFCPKCNTVLANEQVEKGKCWRHSDADVEIKELEQWFFRTTKYADKLYSSIDSLEWPSTIKEMQKNWINPSKGTIVKFKVDNEYVEVFTTRPDTLYGVTFITFAPEHPKVLELVKGTKYEKDVKKFVNKILLGDKFERTEKEKEGMFIGRYAVHPLTKEKIPIFIANFVLLEYGTGVVMAVPAHDQRDYEFARKYNLKIKQVIEGNTKDSAYEGEGNLINSGKFSGLNNKKAMAEITNYLNSKKLGNKTIQYKLRDWLISRQRYWGCPIPVIYCNYCGIVPVPEKDLPVELPIKVDFKSGGNPLATNKKFVHVNCPKCGAKARRETDTMDTFVDSSWYLFRYTDTKNSKKIFDKEKVDYWLPVNQYIGGREHATGHLIYFRFFTKVFKDLGLINFDEPAKKLFNQGDVNKNGIRMSKSKGNVIDPMEMVNEYGADSLRFYLMFLSSPDSVFEWDDKGMKSVSNFVNKFYELSNVKCSGKEKDRIVTSKINSLIEIVTENIETFRYNRALIGIMEFTNYIHKNRDYISQKVFSDSYSVLSSLLHPFIPHITSELNCSDKWPKSNRKLINKEIEYSESFLQNTISDINNIINLIRREPKKIKLSVSESWKYDFYRKLKKEDSKDFNALIKKLMIKEHGKEIPKIVQSYIRNPGKFPEIILSQPIELEALKNNIKMLKKEFNCEIEIDKNDAKAYPGKVSILIE